MVALDPKLKLINLNYQPVIQASTNKFLGIVEQNFKLQQAAKDQLKKKAAAKEATPAVLPVHEAVVRGIDRALLELMRESCLNL